MLGLKRLALRVVRAVIGRTTRGLGRTKYRAFKLFYCPSHRRWQSTHPLINSLGSSAPWVFYDETWLHIVNRWAFRQALACGESVHVPDVPRPIPNQVRISIDGLISVDGTPGVDKWYYLYLDPMLCPWSDYSWKLKIQKLSEFKEFQLAFRYQDFYNRYRYRFQDDKLCFDMVVNGQFYADLSVSYFPLQIGHQYDVEIRAFGNVFECWINGRRVSRDYDPKNRFPAGPIGVILWEDDGVTDIRAELALETVIALCEMPPQAKKTSDAA